MLDPVVWKMQIELDASKSISQREIAIPTWLSGLEGSSCKIFEALLVESYSRNQVRININKGTKPQIYYEIGTEYSRVEAQFIGKIAYSFEYTRYLNWYYRKNIENQMT